ncbi:unnamed protein product [Microthlaspi erraticum]|uniref:Uncharacterized protein n=1 Tax=Microthlaspi erraticum TaxID=1685480 RepID=A0A6D2KS01_9BRAS|nr:unnamed protein product [Microthlaspi erraticum]
MSNGPGLFADIGKLARDLLTREYSSDQKFSISTNSVSGLVLTSTALKKGVVHGAEVATQYKYRNALFNVKIDTDSNVLTSITFSEILPSTKAIASFKVPDYNSSKLEVQYFHDHATVTAAADLKLNPLIDVTATLGSPTISFGAEAGYDTTSRTFSKYNVGVSVTMPHKCASIILGDKGDSIKASYVQQSTRSAAVGELYRKLSTNENIITVGGMYAADHLTNVKAKLNSNGKLGALLHHEVLPKSIVTISGEIDTKTLDKYPRFGLSLSLNP